MLNALMSFMSYSYSYGSDYGYDYGYGDYDTMSGAEAAGAFAGIMAIMGIMLLPAIIVGVVSIIANWKIFTKMGLEGWKSIIPIYNIIVLYEKINVNPLFILVCLIPFVGGLGMTIIGILANIRLCKGFGKSDGFIVGYILLPIIFMCILAFDKSTWDPSKIDMNSFAFLNKDKNPTPAAAPAAGAKPTTTPEDPWVAGDDKKSA